MIDFVGDKQWHSSKWDGEIELFEICMIIKLIDSI